MGTPIDQVAMMAGHSTLDITKRYTAPSHGRPPGSGGTGSLGVNKEFHPGIRADATGGEKGLQEILNRGTAPDINAFGLFRPKLRSKKRDQHLFLAR